MKTLTFFSILFCTIALPALADLTPQDLDKIRLIVNEEVTADYTLLNPFLANETPSVHRLTAYATKGNLGYYTRHAATESQTYS